jgi:DNA-directed RNA polymerase specialized sigma24 family protein
MDTPSEREEEVELARRLMTGDAIAFDRFVEYCRAKIFHYNWVMCGQREDAEDGLPHRQKRLPDEARKDIFAPCHDLSLDRFLPAMDRGVLRSEVKQVLDRAIGALPENYKSVIFMLDEYLRTF